MFVAFWRFAQIFFSPFTTTCELNTPLPLPTLHTPEHQAAPAPLLGGWSFWGQQRVRSGGWRERAQKMLIFFFQKVLPKELGSHLERQVWSVQNRQPRWAGPAAAGPRRCPRCRDPAPVAPAPLPPPAERGEWIHRRAGGSKDKAMALRKSAPDFVTREAEKDPGRQVLFLPGLDAEQTSC